MVTGVLLALLGGLLYAYYAVTAARAIRGGAPSGLVMGQMFGGAAVLSAPLAVQGGVAWLGEPYGLLTALYLGCAATALAYYLYGRGLRGTPVAGAATLALAEPAVAAVLGLAVLGERLSPPSWAGLALLGLALVSVARSAASPGARASPGEGAEPAGGPRPGRSARSTQPTRSAAEGQA